MIKPRLFQVLACVAIVAFFALGQQALAQDDAQSKVHYHIRVMPSAPEANQDVTPLLATPVNLYGLASVFTATDFPTVNSDGSDIWPCFGNTATPNPDCSTIGMPSITFPTGGVALGAPSYSWPLAKCNQTGVGTPSPCGQTETWYEDDTPATTTDDLLYIIEVTQGTGTSTKVIAHSGTVDFGTNPFGGSTPPADVIIFGDQGFGNQGVVAGPNNGNCSADFNYPSATNPDVGVFVIAAGKTCVPAVSGLATLTATTEIATPKYTKQTLASKCAPASAPCYTVTYTKKHSLTQKWNIWLN